MVVTWVLIVMTDAFLKYYLKWNMKDVAFVV